MRITHLSAAALLIALTATSAHAQTATQDITISANVPKACTINNVAGGTTDTATLSFNSNGSVNTSAITPASQPYASVACNFASNLQLSSQNGALTGPSSATGFANVINYTASATWNSVSATVNTATNGASSGAESGTAQPVSTASSGNMTVSITPAANTLPLVYGSYSDTLRITLTPQ